MILGSTSSPCTRKTYSRSFPGEDNGLFNDNDDTTDVAWWRCAGKYARVSRPLRSLHISRCRQEGYINFFYILVGDWTKMNTRCVWKMVGILNECFRRLHRNYHQDARPHNDSASFPMIPFTTTSSLRCHRERWVLEWVGSNMFCWKCSHQVHYIFQRKIDCSMHFPNSINSFWIDTLFNLGKFDIFGSE